MNNFAKLSLELMDEVVLSRRSATKGEHESLDYIPGSTLLGWAASHLYAKLSPEDAYLIFHSGKVRFGNGLPLDGNGERALPMPLCWHEDKGGLPAKKKGGLISGQVFNLMHGKNGGLAQPRQIRAGYVACNGQVIQPSRAYRMKTALNPETSTAEESQLFGYESLERGQHFVANITADDDVPPASFDKVLDIFNGTIRVGRSRSAQYGRVSVEKNDAASPAKQTGVAGATELTLWLVSDLALRDNKGLPTLMPSPDMLGLPGGKLVPEKTFVRFRSYAPYNAFRRSSEMDRQVLLAGSVLTFKLNQPLSEFHIALLSGGIGDFREAGLGEVYVNPELLRTPHPEFLGNSVPARTSHVNRPNDPLIAYLERRSGGNTEEQAAKAWAEEKVKELRKNYMAARNFNGIKSTEPYGPGRVQWRRVMDAATAININSALFGSDGVCKEGDEDWGIEFNKGGTFLSWLEKQLLGITNATEQVRRLQWLARLAESLRDETSNSLKGSAK